MFVFLSYFKEEGFLVFDVIKVVVGRVKAIIFDDFDVFDLGWGGRKILV